MALANRLAILLDCKPDEVEEMIKSQLGYIDRLMAENSVFERDAEQVEEDRQDLLRSREIARNAILSTEDDEPEAMLSAFIQALSDIAAGRVRPR